MKLTATLLSLYIGLFFNVFTGNAQVHNPESTINNSGRTSRSIATEVQSGKRNTSVLNISPNPSSDMLNIERNSAAVTAELQIFDQTGAVIISQKMAEGISKYGLQLSTLKSGAYTIQLTANNTTETKRFIML